MNTTPFRRIRQLTAVLLCLAVLAPAAAAQIQGHSQDLPELTPDSHFPRCTYAELEGLGYPDHKHAWNWSDWTPLTDADGAAYGPGSLCWRKQLQPREGLVVEEGVMRLGHFAIHHNPAYDTCDMLFFLELFELAGRDVPALLGLATDDTLQVISPDNIESYRQKTGFDVWRLYKLRGDECITEPLPILNARTLDGHAVYAMVTEWLLNESISEPLPPWLRRGLAEYIAENGVHLANYMVQFRPNGPVLFSPPLTDAILGGGPDLDKNRDREMYRRASYSAFLMVWELVENQGGLQALQDLLAHAAGGSSLDEACRLVYGMGLQDLAGMLDPTQLGEPIGKAVQSRSPHSPPE